MQFIIPVKASLQCHLMLL